LAAWHNDSLQHQTNRYLKDQFGFRKPLVRLNNQLAWTFYHKARARDIVIGKENWLYEAGYIHTRYGKDYVGHEKLKKWVTQTQKLQKMLLNYGKLLVVVLAPGKASIYPEYIPDHLRETPNSPTNYTEFSALLRQKEVNLIDCNAWFKTIKPTSPYPLYPKTGIHWSVYGKYLVVDSLLQYIQAKTGKDQPNMLHQRPISQSPPTADDRDIERGLNLLFPIPCPPMGYPNVCFDRIGKRMLRSLTIADSYWWGIQGRGIAGRIFRKPEFWYYNEEIYGGPGRESSSVSKIDPAIAFADRDLIILMCTDAKLKHFSWDLLDNYAADPDFEMKMAKASIAQTISEIRDDKSWLKKIGLAAENRGISLDSMLYLNAKYLLWARLPR
ncbi:MAG TPA: hypothetical protein ENJ82_13165, partial [Bacteroidetes bacterium]|nr:hypothetical protein [Bacteroidota bacterium]